MGGGDGHLEGGNGADDVEAKVAQKLLEHGPDQGLVLHE